MNGIFIWDIQNLDSYFYHDTCLLISAVYITCKREGNAGAYSCPGCF